MIWPVEIMSEEGVYMDDIERLRSLLHEAILTNLSRREALRISKALDQLLVREYEEGSASQDQPVKTA